MFRKWLTLVPALFTFLGCSADSESGVQDVLKGAELPLLAAQFADPLLFNCSQYLDSNVDLRSVFGSDCNGATNHWLTYGIHEGRQASAVFGCRAYLSHNPDLHNYWTGNTNSIQAYFETECHFATSHWLTNGIGEGRQASESFSVLAYLTLNPDVEEAYMSTNTCPQLDSAGFNDCVNRNAILHYLSHGIGEGRAAVSAESASGSSESRTADAVALSQRGACTSTKVCDKVCSQVCIDGDGKETTCGAFHSWNCIFELPGPSASQFCASKCGTTSAPICATSAECAFYDGVSVSSSNCRDWNNTNRNGVCGVCDPPVWAQESKTSLGKWLVRTGLETCMLFESFQVIEKDLICKHGPRVKCVNEPVNTTSSGAPCASFSPGIPATSRCIYAISSNDPESPNYPELEPEPVPAPGDSLCATQGFWEADQYDACLQECGSCIRKQDCGGQPCGGGVGYCWKCE